MRFVTLMVLFSLSLTVGCGSTGSLPPIPIPTLMPTPQPFRAQTSFVDGVLSVTVPTKDGQTRTLDSIRDFEGTWGRFLPRPKQPNHSNREWILVDNHYDGRVFLYAAVEWDNADPTDYLAAGWWLTYPPGVPAWAFEVATRGVFLDGPELDPANPPDLPLTGTATYVGGMGGLYTYQYGRSWGELADSTEIAEFQGTGLVDGGLRPKPPHRVYGVRGTHRDRIRSPPRSRRTVGQSRSGGVARRLRCAL